MYKLEYFHLSYGEFPPASTVYGPSPNHHSPKACSPKTNSTTNAPVELKAEITLSHKPVDSANLTRLWDQELVPLVEKGKISAAEALTFMRVQKKRLNMPNSDKIEALDQILKQKGLN